MRQVLQDSRDNDRLQKTIRDDNHEAEAGGGAKAMYATHEFKLGARRGSEEEVGGA